MKATTFFLFIMSFFRELCFSQLPVKDWDAAFGGTKHDQMRAIKHTADGGYIVGGFSPSNANGSKSEPSKGGDDFWIVRTDSNGVKLWDKVFGGSEDDLLTSLETTFDSGYILGGYSRSGISGDKSEPSQGQNDFWIVKTDADGNKQWDKRYGGNSQDYLTTIFQTADSGFILGGYTSSLVSGDVSQPKKGFEDYWLVKTDASGNKQWDARFGGDQPDLMQSLALTPDGGYLLAGTSSSSISGDKSEELHGYSDYWIVKTDSTGIKQWDKTFGGDSTDYCNSAGLTTDGGFILGGSSFSGISYDKSQSAREKDDYWIVKIDSGGTKQWDKTFGGIDWYGEWLSTIFQTADGGYLLAGYSGSPSAGEKSQPYWGQAADYWIVKTDSSGDYLWDRRFGGITDDYCYSALENPDHSFTIGGMSGSGIDGDRSYENQGNPPLATFDYWMLKTTVPGEIPNIYVAPIASTAFMQGNILEVPYNINGTFNPGNTFYAILSGNSGSFDISDTIGSIISTASGSITATIPDTLFNGENYHLRVLSSNPPTVCPTNEEPITIGPYAAAAWDKVYGGTLSEYFSDMIETSDGGFLFGGYTFSDSSGDVSQPLKNEGDCDFWIIKTDSAGNKQWDARYGTKYGGDFLTCMIKTTDSGYMLGGYSGGGSNGDKTEDNRGFQDYWMVKIDSNGAKQWDKTFGGSDFDYLYSILQTSDGGYLLGGESRSPAGFDKSEENKGILDDYWIVKTDASGIKQWDVTLGGNDDEDFFDMAATADGGYLLGGYSRSPISGDVTDSTGGHDYWMVKIDGQGVKEWDRKYGGPVGSGALFSNMEPTFDGGYILCGTAGHLAGNEVSEPGFDTGYGDCWILKIDANGNKQWDKRFGGYNSDYGRSVVQMADSGFLVAGESDSDISGNKTQDSRGDYDYWAIRINSQQEILWDTRFGGSDDDHLSRVIQTSDGNYLLGGIGTLWADGDKTQYNHGGNDFWIVKVNEAVFANSIITNSIFPLVYSASDPVDVPFTASGSFNSGNIFTAQLSDATGNFASPVAIGTLGLDQSGTIDAIIPDSTPAGTQYRVRVVSSNPPITGSDNGEDITVGIPTASILADEHFSFSVYPNPFSSSAIISFSQPGNGDIIIELFDVMGKKIRTVLNKNFEAGMHTVSLNRDHMNSGIYLMKVILNHETYTVKIAIE